MDSESPSKHRAHPAGVGRHPWICFRQRYYTMIGSRNCSIVKTFERFPFKAGRPGCFIEIPVATNKIRIENGCFLAGAMLVSGKVRVVTFDKDDQIE